jgi:hypothetical protein
VGECVTAREYYNRKQRRTSRRFRDERGYIIEKRISGQSRAEVRKETSIAAHHVLALGRGY